MPVKSSSVVRKIVYDSDLKRISPVSVQRGSRILVVHQEADSFAVAIRIASRVGECQGILDSSTGSGPLLIKIGGNTVAVGPAVPASRAVRALRIRNKRRRR